MGSWRGPPLVSGGPAGPACHSCLRGASQQKGEGPPPPSTGGRAPFTSTRKGARAPSPQPERGQGPLHLGRNGDRRPSHRTRQPRRSHGEPPMELPAQSISRYTRAERPPVRLKMAAPSSVRPGGRKPGAERPEAGSRAAQGRAGRIQGGDGQEAGSAGADSAGAGSAEAGPGATGFGWAPPYLRSRLAKISQACHKGRRSKSGQSVSRNTSSA